VGIRLPVDKEIILYHVKPQHIEKFIKHGKKRWQELMPLFIIESVQLVEGSSKDIEDQLHIKYMTEDQE
jgi:hypothetical protein